MRPSAATLFLRGRHPLDDDDPSRAAGLIFLACAPLRYRNVKNYNYGRMAVLACLADELTAHAS